MKKYDAVIAGYLCVDLFPEFGSSKSFSGISEVLVPGKLVEIDGISYSLGGLVANTGIAMQKFGKNVFLNGLVSEDPIGKIALEWLETYGLSEGIRKVSAAGTAFSIVLAPPGIDRIFLEYPGCNKIFDISMIDFDAISKCRLFHFGYPPLLRQFCIDGGKQIYEMLSRVQGMGVITSLDFSLPDIENESGQLKWPEIMRNILPFTDIFVPSLEEALQIMEPERYFEMKAISDKTEMIDHIPLSHIRELGRKIIDYGVKILLIKAGHRGAYLLTGDATSLNDRTGSPIAGNDWNYCELWCNAYKADPLKV
ncbi:MAG: carbohydrate kinase family protein, partial [Bacteroidales bacterium]|nr:carbohydrate kinase family protein [Bacteroidales bacterium]